MEVISFLQGRTDSQLLNIGLVDVGCSGGIAGYWRQIEDYLFALGIDPLVSEIERLNTAEQNPNVLYIDGYVEWADWDILYPPGQRLSRDNSNIHRSSAHNTIAKGKIDYIRDRYNSGQNLVLSSNRSSLDDFAKHMPGTSIDFVKVDTDGFDFPVLKSGTNLLKQGRVLGCKVECLFHGDDHPLSNTFANIDTFMRSSGFMLFDLKHYTYSKSALPDVFKYDLLAQTRGGQVQWGDAIYFRDFCNPNFHSISGWKPSQSQILKQAILFELHGHIDSLVELLLFYKDEFLFAKDLEILLDKLVRRYCDSRLGYSYGELIRKYEADYQAFFPSNIETI